MRWRVILEKKFSTALSQEAEVGVKWGSWTAWRLFNAATYILAGRIAENPSVTRQLHTVIDGVCETVH
jgi:hypothetical protein